MALASYSTSQAAAKIGRGEFWGDTLGNSYTLTYGFRNAASPYVDDYFRSPGFTQFQANQIAATETALKLWSGVANIVFYPVPGGYTNNATMLFGNYNSSSDPAWARGSGPAGATGSPFVSQVPGVAVKKDNVEANSMQGDVWVNLNEAGNLNTTQGALGYLALVHEIGHALGLQHPGGYNADKGVPNYAFDAGYVQDSLQYTVMSYFPASVTGANHVFKGNVIVASTPLLHDIAALQRLYGVNWETRKDGTTYGFTSNAGEPYLLNNANDKVVLSIWDAGGVDTLDFSGYSENQLISLLPDSFSDVGGLTKNVSIAGIWNSNGFWDERALIEHASGGSGNDTIIGNHVGNHLYGNGGNDTFVGDRGNDRINGGEGSDTVSYRDSFFGVTVDLTPILTQVGGVWQLVGKATGYSIDTDTLISIENVTGSYSNDTITGDDENNVIAGLGGGNSLDGRGGIDTVDYSATSQGVTIVLDTSFGVQFAFGSEIATDTFVAFENATGGAGGDTLYGNDESNVLDGGRGGDTLDGRGGGDFYIVDDMTDTVIEAQGGGYDQVLISPTSFNPLSGGAQWVGRFVLTSGSEIESMAVRDATSTFAIDLEGNEFSNVMFGNNGSNKLDGSGAADRMYGLGGNDTYYVDNPGDRVIENFSGGNDTVFTRVSFTLEVVSEVESLLSQGLHLRLTGNALANTLRGDDGNNILDGGRGGWAGGLVDTLVGGKGIDQYVVYNDFDEVVEKTGEGIDVVFSSAPSYTLRPNVENLVLTGSAIFGTGNELVNYITGNGGSNVVDGGAGGDVLDGGGGIDTVTYVRSSTAVWVNLAVGYGKGGDAEGDTLVRFENVTGSAYKDYLYGDGGANVLDGGADADQMFGGLGNDIYIVDNGNDKITENLNEGIDTVKASFSYSLALTPNVENLILLSSVTKTTAAGETIQSIGNINGTGNALVNNITGNDFKNIIDGGGSSDTMAGGLDDDIYILDTTGDVVIEAFNAGFDTVQSSATHTLRDNVEKLILTGTAAINGAGNELVNYITGNSGNNILNGGGGADAMAGNLGNDTFVFNRGQANGDKIIDFNGLGAAAGDKLQFVGYGAGATFTKIDATHWQINYSGGTLHEVITIGNAAQIHASDFVFV